MMLKTLAVLFFVAVCSAFPADNAQIPLKESRPQVLGPQQPELNGEPQDLAADSSYWSHYAYTPQIRRYYSTYYRPSVYTYYTPTYTPTYTPYYHLPTYW